MKNNLLFDVNAQKSYNFGNFLIMIPSKETRDVIEFMND